MKKVKLPSNPVGWGLLIVGCVVVGNIMTAPAERKYNQVKNKLTKSTEAEA